METHSNLLDRLPLQSECEQDRALDGREVDVCCESLVEEEGGNRREEVEDDVVVERVVGIRLESLEIERSEKGRQLLDGEHSRAVSLCSGAGGVDDAERRGRVELAELVRQKLEESLAEVCNEQGPSMLATRV